MDVLKLQKEYGKDLILIGNVDKRALAQGKKEMDAELEKCRKAMEFGGFFPNPDHHVPPDVPYENIVYFINELRKFSHYEETRRVIPS
jgi:uroporphyrinogen decarboxylase